ncbi:hypothetical protein [uncultured Litoreibacter sp.]|uniref:hypothetical protein n=1 Tax=uncultured Litoreibacter sp. TaxID=1392394 RepID=UPI00262227E9|nr:hypothetical protein [uncultured Litoreibacter sp.]
MTNDWIIDVLTDLQKFSATNSMGKLADRLDDTIALAARELSAHHTPEQMRVGEFEQARGHARSTFTSENA